MSVLIRETAPSPDEFCTFREACWWGTVELEIARIALENSLLIVSAYEDDVLIGFVRVVGDGVLNVYIQDLIVDERHRGHGIGAQLMTYVLKKLKSDFPATLDIGLMSAEGKEGFYEAFGFKRRPGIGFGAGMMLYAT